MKSIFTKNNKILELFIIGLIFGVMFTSYDTALAQNLGQDIGSLVRTSSAIREFWGFFLSIANYILVAALLAMAFGTSLRIDSYTVKKVLPNLLIAFVLANASLFIIGIAIDIADILTNIVKPSWGDMTSAIFSRWGALLVLIGIGGTIAFFGGPAGWFLGVLLVLLLFGFWFLVIFSLWLFFFIRYIALQLYVVSAPLAFMSLALPSTRSFFQSWASGFFSWLMAAPIAYATMAVGVAILRADILPIVGFFLGMFIIVAAIIMPFRVKGIGSSVMAQFGGAIQGFGKSFGKSTAGAAGRGAVGAMESRGGRVGQLGAALGMASQIPAALKNAEQKSKRDFARRGQRALRQSPLGNIFGAGDASAMEAATEERKKDFAANGGMDWFATDPNLRMAGDQSLIQGALDYVKENPREIQKFANQLAKEVLEDDQLAAQLGFKGQKLEDVALSLMSDGSQLASSAVGLAGFNLNEEIDYGMKRRLEAYGDKQVEAGYIQGKVLFDENGKLENDKDIRSSEIARSITDNSASLAKATNANPSLIDKDSNIAVPHFVQLFANKQFDDEALKGTSQTALTQMAKQIAKVDADGKNSFIEALKKETKVVTRDRNSGKLKETILPAAIRDTNFNVADLAKPISANDDHAVQQLKKIYAGGRVADPSVAGDRDGSRDAMIKLINKDEAGKKLLEALNKQNEILSNMSSRRQSSASFNGPFPSTAGLRPPRGGSGDDPIGGGGGGGKGPNNPDGGSSPSSPSGGGGVNPSGGSGSQQTPEMKGSTREVVNELKSAASELRRAAGGISGASAGLSGSAQQIRQAASDSSASSRSTFRSSEELSESARNTQRSSKETLGAAERTSKAARRTGRAAREIGKAAENLGSVGQNTQKPPAPPEPPIQQ